MVSKFRPNMPIVATTPNEKTYRKLALSWGVYPVKSEVQGNSDALFTHAIKRTHEENYITKNDLAVIAAGIPLGESTNTLRVITVK